MQISCNLSSVYINIRYNLGFAENLMQPFSHSESQAHWPKLNLMYIDEGYFIPS